MVSTVDNVVEILLSFPLMVKQTVGSGVRSQFSNALPTIGFPFDGAISNLPFHEVQSVADKCAVVQEALRVVKPGGNFAFVDYFYDEKYYRKSLEFKKYLQDLKLARFEYKPISDLIAIPIPMKHPKIFGKVGIIYGRK